MGLYRYGYLWLIIALLRFCLDNRATILYGVKRFAFNHDMFTTNRKHINAFCDRMIADNLPFVWGCSSRIDVLDQEMIDKMKKANCLEMYVGVETGSKSMQVKIRKNLDLDKVKEKLLLIRKSGIKVTVSFIYGFPSETIQEFWETLDLIKYLFINGIRRIQLHLFMPLPKTDETESVYDKLYFDYNNADISILNPKYLNEEMKKIIEKNKTIFSAYYTFDSEVRKTYSKIEVLIMTIGNTISIYKFFIKKIIKNIEIKKLYFLFKSDIVSCYNNIYLNSDANIKSEKEVLAVYYALAEKIISNLGYDGRYPEMYQFESDLKDFYFSNATEPYMKLYKMDVVTLRETGMYIPEETIIKFYRNEYRQIRFERMPIKIVNDVQ